MAPRCNIKKLKEEFKMYGLAIAGEGAGCFFDEYVDMTDEMGEFMEK